eukprot:31091_6
MNMYAKNSSRCSMMLSLVFGLASICRCSRSVSCTAISLARIRMLEFAAVYQISKKMLGASSPMLNSAWKLFRRRNLYIYVMARVMAVLR